MYGSIFIGRAFSPEARRSLAMEAVITPFPRPDMTPPVTNMYFLGPGMGQLRGALIYALPRAS
jgi:hypothetical protein